MQIIADGPDNPMDNQCYVAVFFSIHVGFGMIGWPICFLLFLFVCVMGQNEERGTTRKSGCA